jgi:hypothetical protein
MAALAPATADGVRTLGNEPSTSPTSSPGSRRGLVRTVLSLGVEIVLVLGLLALYKLGRSLATGHVEEAEHNAAHLWSLERSLHLLNEDSVQHLLLHSRFLVEAANRYYVTVHFPLTGIFLVWLFLRHHGSYYRLRNTLVLTTLFGLLFTVFVPLAPPRLFTGDRLIDTMQIFGPSAYNPDSTTGVANQYAAMPSLHIAWAVLVGITVVRVSRSRWRYLAILHPIITIFVVVATGNHYWLDGFVGLALLGISAIIVYRMRWIRAVLARVTGISAYSTAARHVRAARANVSAGVSEVGRSASSHRARRVEARERRAIAPPNR